MSGDERVGRAMCQSSPSYMEGRHLVALRRMATDDHHTGPAAALPCSPQAPSAGGCSAQPCRCTPACVCDLWAVGGCHWMLSMMRAVRSRLLPADGVARPRCAGWRSLATAATAAGDAAPEARSYPYGPTSVSEGSLLECRVRCKSACRSLAPKQLNLLPLLALHALLAAGGGLGSRLWSLARASLHC